MSLCKVSLTTENYPQITESDTVEKFYESEWGLQHTDRDLQSLKGEREEKKKKKKRRRDETEQKQNANKKNH